MANDKGAQVFRPNTAESTRHIEQTADDRAKHLKEFREDKEHKQKLKEERFAKIQERRKKHGPGQSGGGINIEVTSDS